MTAPRDTRPCAVLRYIGGAFITVDNWANVAEAMARSDEGQWFPIDEGFRSADGFTLIVISDWHKRSYRLIDKYPPEDQEAQAKIEGRAA